jgi:hypothetical protein
MKFFSVLVSALLCASPFVRANKCPIIDYQKKNEDFSQLNGVVDIAVSSGLLKKSLEVLDPISIQNKQLKPVPFNVLGVDFEYTPTIKTLTVNGVSAVTPRHFNVTSSDSIQLGADILTDLRASGTIHLSVRQTERKWYIPCWTDLFRPKRCKPTEVDVDIRFGVKNAAIAANTQVVLLACPDYAGSKCTDLSVSDLLMAGLSGSFDGFFNRLMSRTKQVNVKDLSLSFDTMTNFAFHFHTSGKLITAMGKKLFQFAQNKVNNKSQIYSKLINIVQGLMKNLGNKIIAETLSPKFGANCYDA